MDNEEKALREMINAAAAELTQLLPAQGLPNIGFEEAQSLIQIFILTERQAEGHPRLVIGKEGVDSIRVDNIVRNFTFLDLVDLASDGASLISNSIVLAIMGGLLFLRLIFGLSKVHLSPVDSLMIIALLNSKRDEGYTDEEWFEKLKKVNKFNIRIKEDFNLTQLIERADSLKKLHAVELLEGKWRFSDKIVIRN